jgi:hypothetical protein
VAAHLERVASAIVGTGGAAAPIQLAEPALDPDLDKYRRMDPRVIVGATLDTTAGGILHDIRADYLAKRPHGRPSRHRRRQLLSDEDHAASVPGTIADVRAVQGALARPRQAKR